jgi:DDE superfamily endonuclease/Helix-turn-helix of DDE superfamily endonuclease
MITYPRLSRKPTAFRSMTGLTPAEFEALLEDFLAAQVRRRQAATRTKRSRQPRCRAVGAGHPYAHDDRSRLLMTLIWLRVYPTYEVLGLLFDLEKSNAWENVQDVLATLETLADFPFERPTAERKKLGSVAAVMDAFPQVRLVIDAKEQRVERPEGDDRQRPYYSGKKKAHTIKNQIAVAPDGRIEAVSDSVPGGANHDLRLLRDTALLHRLDPEADEGAMLDKGYTGIAKDHPELPLFLPHKARRNHPLTEEQRDWNRLVARYRIVVEHVIAQLNRFQALRQVFRSAIGRHRGVIRVVAALVDRRIRIVPLKTYAAA